MKQKLETELINRGLAVNKFRAYGLIKTGKVKVNGLVSDDPSFLAGKFDSVEVEEAELPFVSREALKIKAAVEYFKVKVAGKVCLDIGVGIGGATDYLIKSRAETIYAVYPESRVFDKDVNNDGSVKLFVGKITDFKIEGNGRVDFVWIDSNDSLESVLKLVYRLVEDDGTVIATVKPQIEYPQAVSKDGGIHDDAIFVKTLETVHNLAVEAGFKVRGIEESTVGGDKDNREFWMVLNKNETESDRVEPCQR